MLKLEIQADKAPDFEFNYGTEGPIELSQLTVNSLTIGRVYFSF
jgi:hypothetical protein